MESLMQRHTIRNILTDIPVEQNYYIYLKKILFRFLTVDDTRQV